MAKTKEIADGAEIKHPAKKATKAKLTFTAGSPVQKEVVNMTAEEAGLIPTDKVIDMMAQEAVNITEALVSNNAEEAGIITSIPAKKQSIKSTSVKTLHDFAGLKDEVQVPKEPNFEQPVRDIPKPKIVDEIPPIITGGTSKPTTFDSSVLPVEEVKKSNYAKSDTVKHYEKGSNKPYNNPNKYNGNGTGPKPSSIETAPPGNEYPEHMSALALLVKNNAEIRRFTSIGILNYLKQKGEIRTSKGFVTFKWNKFTIKIEHLIKEYSYSEPFFLNCLCASFSSFAASAQRTMNNFTRKELNKELGEHASQEEIESIAENNENR